MDELFKLEQTIKDRIEQIRHKMHKTHNRAYTDSLWTEIETLNWVLNEILVLSRNCNAQSQASDETGSHSNGIGASSQNGSCSPL
ncbi:MAG: hypothetical protein DLM72_06190 [Candidatus Nitrosopolaris wilkensis]|nr:MAG: hypothetical protein DLM72_06190 [Candidatus Nitrosopolaris wilkensis]